MYEKAIGRLFCTIENGLKYQGLNVYRITVEGPPYRDTIPFAQKVVEAAPDRCVWGSDWPHVANWDVMMGVADLLDLLADWVSDETIRNRILTDNPQRLFGFPAVA